MNRLPTGMYQPGTSFIHRLQAVSKLLSFLILIVAVISADTPAGYCILVLLTVLLIYLAGIGPETALNSVHRLRWFFVMIFLMNLCFFAPEDPWIRFWFFCPSPDGLFQGITVVSRVFLLLVLSNILTITTAPLELTQALETFLLPLQLFRIPAGQIAMILSVSIQFIPALFEETDMIRKAQIARGARFDSHRLRDRAQAVLPLVVPIFLAAFKRADDLSLAMESRGYRTDAARIHRKAAPLTWQNLFSVILCLGICVLYIFYL